MPCAFKMFFPFIILVPLKHGMKYLNSLLLFFVFFKEYLRADLNEYWKHNPGRVNTKANWKWVLNDRKDPTGQEGDDDGGDNRKSDRGCGCGYGHGRGHGSHGWRKRGNGWENRRGCSGTVLQCLLISFQEVTLISCQ